MKEIEGRPLRWVDTMSMLHFSLVESRSFDKMPLRMHLLHRQLIHVRPLSDGLCVPDLRRALATTDHNHSLVLLLRLPAVPCAWQEQATLAIVFGLLRSIHAGATVLLIVRNSL